MGSGSRGYSLRPWREETAAVPAALARLGGERVVLVQSGLFPHAGYDGRVQLLTPETLADPRNAGAAVLLSPRVSAYPFWKSDLARLLDLPPVAALSGNLAAVRLSRPPGVALVPTHHGRRGHRRRKDSASG